MSATPQAPAPDPREYAQRGMMLAYHARNAPQSKAISSEAGNRTFAELNARANQLVRTLRARGLKSGDSVALVCSNRPEFAEVYAACLRSGLRITPVNWHLTAREIGYIVDNCEASALVADVRFGDAAAGALEGNARVHVRLAVGGPIAGFALYDQALGEHPVDDIEDPEPGGQMLYTSGTTGNPKGVYRRRQPLGGGGVAAAGGGALSYKAGEDAHLCTGPLYHAAPLAFSLAGPLNAGAHVVMMDGWDPARALDLIAQERVTHTHMVPTMFHRLLGLPEEMRSRPDLKSLRVILHGAAPCPVHVKQAMMDWLGPIVYEYYAATEGFGSFVRPEVWLQRPGTVGKPAPEQVQILDEEGRVLPPGQVGKVYLRSPENARFEYFRDEKKTASAYRPDSPYYTLGDMGYMDADGFLFLSDRSADVIISGGVNIYPAEIDAVLLTHPAVSDTATVGVPNDDWGEEVRAVVTLRPGHAPGDALEAELVEHCRARLAHFKCPRRIDFVAELPRHDTGKIYRRLVRDRYWEGRQRRI